MCEEARSIATNLIESEYKKFVPNSTRKQLLDFALFLAGAADPDVVDVVKLL